MLRILQSNQPLAVALLPITAAVLLAARSIFGVPPSELCRVGSWWSATWGLPGGSGFYYLALLMNAFAVNAFFNRHELSDGRNNFAGWFYILLAAAVPAYSPLDPSVVGVFFVIAGLNEVLKVYRQNDAGAHYFNAGFLFGVAALFSHLLLITLPLLLASVFYTRAVNWREIFLPAIGFSLPASFMLTLLWLFDRNPFLFHTPTEACPVDLPTTVLVTLLVIGLLSLIGLLAMLSTFSASGNKSKNSKAILLIFVIGLLVTAFSMFKSEPHAAQSITITIASLMLPWPLVGRIERKHRLYFIAALLACFTLYMQSFRR
jgi:hypothetical protein